MLYAGLAGWVCDGPVRDAIPIREIGFSAFCRGTVPRVAGRDGLGEINVSIHCGRTVVESLWQDEGVMVATAPSFLSNKCYIQLLWHTRFGTYL